MAKRRSGSYRGYYKMTPRRRYALKKAQEASARKRKAQRNKKIAKTAGAIAGIAVAGYLGTRYGSSKIQQSVKNNRIQAMTSHRRNIERARMAVNPGVKEATRVSSAISVAPPSRTTITDADRQRAQNTRDKLNQPKPPPAHMSGETEKITEASVRKTLREAKKATQGEKAASLTGTPGGTKTPPNAIPHRPETWKEEDWKAAMAFDTPVNQPLSGGPRGRGTTGVPQRDPLHTLAKMQWEDNKLLGDGGPPTGTKIPSKVKITTTTRVTRSSGKKPTGKDKDAIINAALNANPGVSREYIIKKLGLE